MPERLDSMCASANRLNSVLQGLGRQVPRRPALALRPAGVVARQHFQEAGQQRLAPVTLVNLFRRKHHSCRCSEKARMRVPQLIWCWACTNMQVTPFQAALCRKQSALARKKLHVKMQGYGYRSAHLQQQPQQQAARAAKQRPWHGVQRRCDPHIQSHADDRGQVVRCRRRAGRRCSSRLSKSLLTLDALYQAIMAACSQLAGVTGTACGNFQRETSVAIERRCAKCCQSMCAMRS